MGFLNLALGQLLGLFLPLAGFLVALYFYDRSRRRVLVSTLRFWPKGPAPAVRRRHRRIQHPLSLLLQLAALLLLLLAIADPRPGTLGTAARQHVLMLDTSAVMAQSGGSGGGLMGQAKALALAYVQAVGSRDRILLVEADGAPTVRVPFTLDRQRVQEAIQAAEPGWTALDLGAACELAAGALRLALDLGAGPLPESRDVGETVYVGPGRTAAQPVRMDVLPRLRYLETEAPSDTIGLLALRAASDPGESGKWNVELQAQNYTERALVVELEFFFEGKRLGRRQLRLPARKDADLRFTLRTRLAGRLLARAAVEDSYAGNNEAFLEIPTAGRTRLQVLGASRGAFEPLLAAGARIEPSFVESQDELADDALHVWARGGAGGSSRRAIYLAPPGTASPVRAVGAVRRRRIEEWSPSHPLAQGVRGRDVIPVRARLFEAQSGDEIVAGTSEGPVILARSQAGRRMVAFGFDLADDSVRGRLAAPLLFANAVNWLDPDAFRPERIEARPPGAVEVEAPNSSLDQIAVRPEAGDAVPWVFSDGKVRFYTDKQGTYRVTTADRRITLYLNQPRIPASDWEPPDSVLRGLPGAADSGGEPWLPWPWLAALGALLLLHDWIRFGRGRLWTTETPQGAGIDAAPPFERAQPDAGPMGAAP